MSDFDNDPFAVSPLDDVRISEITARVHVPGDAFGYRGNVTIERKAELAQPVTPEYVSPIEAALVASITDDVIKHLQAAAAKVADAAGSLPARAVPGITQVSPVPAGPAPSFAAPITDVAAATDASGVSALANGAAPAGGLVSVAGTYGEVHFPHPQALSTQDLKNGVLAQVAQVLECHPSQVVIFDNRADMLAGRPSGHMAAIKIAKAGAFEAQQAMGSRAVAWVDWDLRQQRIVLRPTKDFKALPLNVRAALQQPAPVGGGNPF